MLNVCAKAQWVQIERPGNSDLNKIVYSGTNIFAGTENEGVYLSTNDGTSWTQVNNGLTDSTVRALAVYGTNVFAGTADSGIYRSTNNGTNWTIANNGYTSNHVIGMAVSNGNILAGGFGLYISSDNGSNWNLLGFRLIYYWGAGVSAIAADSTNIYCSDGENLCYSTDKGTNWKYVYFDDVTNIEYIAARGAKIYAQSGMNVISTNYGTNWFTVNKSLNKVIINGDNLFASTNNGVIYSADNGRSWISGGLDENTVYTIAVNDNYLFADTKSSGFWRRPLGDFTSVPNESNNLPHEFNLSQNYPNPFNPSTTINYSLPKAGNVKLIIYNILGSKVATIVNEYKPAGNYSVQFNASSAAGGLASGIYLYRLESGTYCAAKKFILIK